MRFLLVGVVFGMLSACGNGPCKACEGDPEAFETCEDSLSLCELFGPTPLRGICRSDAKEVCEEGGGSVDTAAL